MGEELASKEVDVPVVVEVSDPVKDVVFEKYGEDEVSRVMDGIELLVVDDGDSLVEDSICVSEEEDCAVGDGITMVLNPDIEADIDADAEDSETTEDLKVDKDEERTMDDFNAEEETTRGRDANGLDEGNLEVEAILFDMRLELPFDVVEVPEKVLCFNFEDDLVNVSEENKEVGEGCLEDVFDIAFDDDLEIDLNDGLVVDVLTVEDLDVAFDVALDEVFGAVFMSDTATEVLDPDELLDMISDDVFDGSVERTFVVEMKRFMEDVLLLEAGTAPPSTHLHNLTSSLAEYFANGEVVLGLA